MRHIRDIHENAGRVFHCEICLKPEEKNLGALQAHMHSYHKADKV